MMSWAVAGLVALSLAAGPPGGQSPVRAPCECVRAFHRGEYERAIALARECLKARAGDLEAGIVLARAEAALGRYEAAYAGFRQALRADPRSADALYYLGITAGVLAQAEYERLFALAPESARAHQLLAESFQAQDRTAEAEAEFKAALAASPRSVEVLVALGELTRAQSRFDEAAEYYRRATEIAPRNYDAVYGLGVCQSYQGQHAQAIESFRHALRVDPRSAPARLALGHSLLRTGHPLAAVSELKAAGELEPRMRQAFYLLGRAYQALGRSSEAEAAFAKVQELARQESEAAEATLESGDPLGPPPP